MNRLGLDDDMEKGEEKKVHLSCFELYLQVKENVSHARVRRVRTALKSTNERNSPLQKEGYRGCEEKEETVSYHATTPNPHLNPPSALLLVVSNEDAFCPPPSSPFLKSHSLRLILFLYIILHPHSLHRIGSLALISFDEAQSVLFGSEVSGREGKQREGGRRDGPAQRYSTAGAAARGANG